MLDIKFVRDNPEAVKENIRKKFQDKKLPLVDEVLELLMDLNATDEQLDSPMLFCSGRQGTASYSPDVPGTDLQPLLSLIHISEPTRH